MRADLILDCTGGPGSTHRVVDDFYPRRAYRLLELRYAKEQAASGLAGTPMPRLAPNALPEPDLAKAERHRVVFGGGMMRAMPSQREQRGLFWTVNGKPIAEAHHGVAPLMTLARNRSCVMDLVNDTSWHHPIHLHGHAFRVISVDGKPERRRHWADTVLLDPDSRAEIAFVADNPGDWMFHCHVLEHQASGMMAVVRVA
jgi:FtsP/CotA-like multicopper oxidase with cupredoxin domain